MPALATLDRAGGTGDDEGVGKNDVVVEEVVLHDELLVVGLDEVVDEDVWLLEVEVVVA